MKYLFGVIVTFFAFRVASQDILSFTLETDQTNCPVSVSLEQSNYNTDTGDLALFEQVKGDDVPVRCQVEYGQVARLWFILPDRDTKGKKRSFVVRRSEPLQDKQGIDLSRDHENLDLTSDGKKILSYRHAAMMPPEDVDPLFQRSGYIHPLVSPGGEVLTRIQPPDHYHHYGVWGPWTKTHRLGMHAVRRVAHK